MRQELDSSAPAPGQATSASGLLGQAAPLSLAALLTLSACGERMSDLILPGGIPASTDLHQASTLPPDSVRTVARRDYGWRLIYHPGRAPANAEQGAARALCGLERRPVARIEHLPRLDPLADPGARIIDITCA
ncbi:hypothetical protein [Paracoccus spongiarum]|uniref:Uncharacterized protein n=1 Tax=Paracoccus spongiarum TaxID=3064387 RepID=A0ABT9JEP9_9RHOB|nr:hypothetical protein [Paracoccus sp. 2205BS29-5]MDP5308288.1 hypothetical protein [Paracoccus sp. 2205BS29-5]